MIKTLTGTVINSKIYKRIRAQPAISRLIVLLQPYAARLRHHMFGPAVYRPEAHYMRGPGPKCREKFFERR